MVLISHCIINKQAHPDAAFNCLELARIHGENQGDLSIKNHIRRVDNVASLSRGEGRRLSQREQDRTQLCDDTSWSVGRELVAEIIPASPGSRLTGSVVQPSSLHPGLALLLGVKA